MHSEFSGLLMDVVRSCRNANKLRNVYYMCIYVYIKTHYTTSTWLCENFRTLSTFKSYIIGKGVGRNAIGVDPVLCDISCIYIGSKADNDWNFLRGLEFELIRESMYIQFRRIIRVVRSYTVIKCYSSCVLVDVETEEERERKNCVCVCVCV